LLNKKNRKYHHRSFFKNKLTDATKQKSKAKSYTRIKTVTQKSAAETLLIYVLKYSRIFIVNAPKSLDGISAMLIILSMKRC